MTTETQEKMSKLPVWARELIGRLESLAAPNLEEMVRLRKEVERQKAQQRKQADQIAAMVLMFQCAAKGGNEVASAVQRIVEDFLIGDE